MAKVEHTSDARVLVGIDISKNRHEVLIAGARQGSPPQDDRPEHCRKIYQPTDRCLC
jgi:hypothetical protein